MEKYNKENIKETNYYVIENNKKIEEFPQIYDPNWIGLGRIKLTYDGTSVPEEPLYVPENLLDDIFEGKIDPEQYTPEQLEALSQIKQETENMIRYDGSTNNEEDKYDDIKNNNDIPNKIR